MANFWGLRFGLGWMAVALAMASSCKTSGPAGGESLVMGAAAPAEDVFQGISTEHYFDKIGQTHCGLSQAGLKQLAGRGYHYIAVSQAFFDKYGGKACGKVFEVTVGGACYRSSDMTCLKEHAPLDQVGGTGYRGGTTAKFVVADLCPECQSVTENGVTHFHLDILNSVYRGRVVGLSSPAPLEGLRTFLKGQMQTVKGPGGLTFHENNLYLSEVKATGECLSLARMMTELKAALPADAKYWLPGRYCD